MGIAAPWLKARKDAIRGVCLDGLASWISFEAYGVLHLKGIGTTDLTPLKVWMCWAVYAYLFGRYTLFCEDRTKHHRTWLSGLTVAILTLLTVVVEGWWTGNSSGTGLRSFLVPAIGSIYFLSCLKDYWLCKDKQRHLIVCGDVYKSYILGELQRRRIEEKRVRFIEGEDFTKEDRDWISTVSSGRLIIAIEDSFLNNNSVCSLTEGILKNGLRVITLEEWIESEFQQINVDLMDNKWFYTSSGFSLRPGRFYWRLKRLIDVIIAFVLLVALTPLALIAAVLVKLEDGGTIFYRQVRTGMYGKEIWITKIRSMIQSAETNGAQWAIKGDKRITKVGKILRKTRIDELPQLWSVIRGDLSLIGPRPERPEIESSLVKHLENYRYRHWVRPGLSGWAQVCYRYGSSIEDSKIKLAYDIYYLKNASLLMDALIVLKTIRLVIQGGGQ